MNTTMKKIYCKPGMLITTIHTQHLIADSMRMFNESRDGKSIDNAGDVLIKRDRSSYNVWDDDWQNQ